MLVLGVLIGSRASVVLQPCCRGFGCDALVRLSSAAFVVLSRVLCVLLELVLCTTFVSEARVYVWALSAQTHTYLGLLYPPCCPT